MKDQNAKLFWKNCMTFPNSSEKFEFIQGWSGNEDGFKEEMFMRHEENSKYVAWLKERDKPTAAISNNIIPEVNSLATSFLHPQMMNFDQNSLQLILLRWRDLLLEVHTGTEMVFTFSVQLKWTNLCKSIQRVSHTV